MPVLGDLFDLDLLATMLADRYVSVTRHPTLPLRIYNYTVHAQFDRMWNPVTTQCRGLIVDDNDVVVARPFTKFFNFSDFPHLLRPKGPISVTEKMDGCFCASTTLNLWGGGTITIGDVVRKRLPVVLVGMDTEGHLVPTTVTDWHNNGTKDAWLDIEINAPVSRKSGAAGWANKLRVTPNHSILANGKFAPAGGISIGDTLITQTWAPSASILHLIQSSLLGDGCLVSSTTTKHKQARYHESHTFKHAEYVKYLRECLGTTESVRHNDTLSGYGSHMTWVCSKEYRALGDMREAWYTPDRVKHVPDDLSWMDDFSVAKWVMDDGSLMHSLSQQDRLSLSTHGFSKEDCHKLAARLTEMYGVTCVLSCDKRCGGFSIRVNTGRDRKIDVLWSAIAPHIHPVFRYKVPKRYRDVPFIAYPVGQEVVVPMEAKVLSVASVEPTKKNFPSGRVGFDISTTTTNYMAKGVIVHNSLGILYPHSPGELQVATKGSFVSAQALHATKLWTETYAPASNLNPAWTYLFEIIYPENRIVIDYAGRDELVLLGAVDTESGANIALDKAAEGWSGPVVESHDFASIDDLLVSPDRSGKEGFVVYFTDTDVRVKVKHAEYLQLHKLITDVSERRVWEALIAGIDTDLWLRDVPDEFFSFVSTCRQDLLARFAEILRDVQAKFSEITASLPVGFSRREFAAVVLPLKKTYPYALGLFMILDGTSLDKFIWNFLKPVEHLPLFTQNNTAD